MKTLNIILIVLFLIAAIAGIYFFNKKRSEIPEYSIEQLTLKNEILAKTDDVDISFAKFKIEAKKGDVLLNKVSFLDGHGSFNDIGNLSIWVDTNGDGKSDSRPEQKISKGDFNELFIEDISGTGFLIKNNENYIFEIKGDAKSFSEKPDGIQLILSKPIEVSNSSTKEILVDNNIKEGSSTLVWFK